jgi:hypothetical protein
VGPLGGKWRPSAGKVREWYAQSRHLQGCSLCLCLLRTNGLAPVSKYWTYRSHASDMGLVSLVVYCRQIFDFLHCFIAWLGREARYEPIDRSVGVLWIVSEALFLRSSDSIQLRRWLMEGCHVRGPPAGSVRRAYMDWLGKRTCRVDQVFPYTVYIDSNHRGSRIWVTACSCQSWLS